MKQIKANDISRLNFRYQDEFEEKALSVLRSGHYVLGPEVTSFEKEFAAFAGSDFCVGLGSGLDALWLSFRILGIGRGDEVIVPSNTYIASVMGITINGAKPVLSSLTRILQLIRIKIESKISERTKAILSVEFVWSILSYAAAARDL